MEIALLIISLFGLSIVSMNLALSIVLNGRYHLAWTRWFIVFMSALLGVGMLMTLDVISSLFFTARTYLILHIIWKIFIIADSAFLCTFAFFFSNWLVARPMSRVMKWLAYIMGAIYLVLAILNEIFPAFLSLYRARYSIVVVILFYVVFVMLSSYKGSAHKRVKSLCLTFSIISFSMIPVIISAFFIQRAVNITIQLIGLAFSISILVFLYLAIGHKEEEVKRSDNIKKELTLDSVKAFGITVREFEVIKLIKEGETNKEIAQTLGISVNTVNNHIANIFAKTEVRSRIDLLNLLEEAAW